MLRRAGCFACPVGPSSNALGGTLTLSLRGISHDSVFVKLAHRVSAPSTEPATLVTATLDRHALNQLAEASTKRSPFTWSHLLTRFTRLQSSGPSGGPSGGGGNSSNNSGSGNNGGDGDGEPEPAKPPEDEGMEKWLVPYTVQFVLAMILISVTLWFLSRPWGKQIGWASLTKDAGSIRAVNIYESYIEVPTEKGYRFLGKADDGHTQRNMDKLADAYRAARFDAHQEEQKAKLKLDAAEKASGKKKEDASAGSAAQSASSEASASSQKPNELPVQLKGRPLAESALIGFGVFAWVVPFIFFPVFVMFLSQFIGKSIMGASDAAKGGSKIKEMIFKVEKSSNTRFRDIAGMKEPKKEVTEIVDFLRYPERYTKLGAKIPTGALLLGPPGTGKTLLAKAVAGESGVGFIPVAGSDFVEMYVGMGALRVRQLFKEAKKQRCIIYIDEIDAIGMKRQGAGRGEKQETEQTLNELLTQLDGFNTGKRGEVMVLASSNVDQDALDPALIRPGRFDRIIHVDSPVIVERVDIFKVHLSKLKLVADAAPEAVAKEEAVGEAQEKDTNKPAEADTTVESKAVAAEEPAPSVAATETGLVLSSLAADKAGDAKLLEQEAQQGHASFDFRSLLMSKTDEERALIDSYAARMSNLCPGFVGSDIANVCNEGAILAAREGSTHVTIHHLERSIDRVIAGIEHRSRAMSDFEKNVVAHHEAGHAVAGWFLNRADPLMKVSIVPRGGSALGYAQYLPNENYNRTAKEIRDSMSVTLGGRVAEKIFFDHLSTGASDDLRKVASMAYQYVSSFSPGPVYPAPGTDSTRYVKPFGSKRSDNLDVNAKKLVDDVYEDTYKLLLSHKQDMETLAKHLLTNEMLTYNDVVAYLGARPERGMDRKKGI